MTEKAAIRETIWQEALDLTLAGRLLPEDSQIVFENKGLTPGGG